METKFKIQELVETPHGSGIVCMIRDNVVAVRYGQDPEHLLYSFHNQYDKDLRRADIETQVQKVWDQIFGAK